MKVQGFKHLLYQDIEKRRKDRITLGSVYRLRLKTYKNFKHPFAVPNPSAL